jgi:hypothetical protein
LGAIAVIASLQMSLSRIRCSEVTDFFSVTVFDTQNWA